MPSRKGYLVRGKQSQAREEQLRNAVDGIRSGRFKDCKDAAKQLKIPHTTLWRRFTEKSKAHSKAHMRQQLLNNEQEQVLVNYATWLGMAGTPLSKRTIGPKVEALCGRKPSRRWICRFLARHPECILGRPTGLDPKRARNFNFATVDKYFKKLQQIFDTHKISWSNIYNLDEIGIQLGGGRKSTGELFLFSANDRVRYKIKSDELELVTVIEIVCGDGTSTVKPGFVFAGVNFCEDWFNVDEEIVYELYSCYSC